jgi:NDP-sugar pyrophosphorylase family protein
MFPSASAIANVDRIGGKPITASVIPSAGSSGAFVLQYTLDDVMRVECSFEREVLPGLAKRGLLAADLGVTFWHPMDTPADHADLSAIYKKDYPNVPWLRT